ncbi:MAG: AmmeMemoRadiSam system radical SAM enzyme [Gemmatimonadetes bacterium]|nr:AmmeMemoRadiSam system radical SAM enzyme [Gemmatimonadota bacterium]
MTVRSMHRARWWRPESDGRILCTLCPRDCRLRPGQAGFCYIRQNHEGELVTLGYGRPTAVAADPIEKKPLNHFLPGTDVLSFGTAGCNLGCKFCQNWDISKAKIDEIQSGHVSPERIVQTAIDEKCDSIAFTYNDPVIFGEFVIDVARIARSRGVHTVMVTAGYVHEEPRREIFAEIDAANVDLKGFTNEFYRKTTLSDLDPVRETLLRLRHETDVWLEITTLLIPGLNDSNRELSDECAWIARELGTDVPVHFTAFHPDYRMQDRPPTPPSTLHRARHIAHEAGLQFVYVGNIHDPAGQTTFCPGCDRAVIERNWHSVLDNHIDHGKCGHCGHAIPGVFRDTRNGPSSPGLPRRVTLSNPEAKPCD